MAIYLPTIDELNLNQKMVLSFVPKLEKIAVLGGPGTGKTVLAILAMKEMAKMKKKCLFICYSKVLETFIKNLITTDNLISDYVEVKTYYSFFQGYYSEVAKDENNKNDFEHEIKYKRPINHAYDFFNKYGNFKFSVKELDDFYKKYNVYQKYNKTYDYIFIDEGQDLEDGLIKLTLNFTKHLFFTFDDSQKLRQTNIDNPSKNRTTVLKDLGMENDFFDLIENYRNTEIIEIISKEINTNYETNNITLKKSTTLKPNSKDKTPTIYEIDDNSIGNLIDIIVKDYLRNSERIVAILFYDQNRELAEKTFNKFKNELIKKSKINFFNLFYRFGNKAENNNLKKHEINKNGIYLFSTTTSKGFEFDEVYLITKNMDYNDFYANKAAYVAITRSLDNVNFIIYKDEKDLEMNKKLIKQVYIKKVDI